MCIKTNIPSLSQTTKIFCVISGLTKCNSSEMHMLTISLFTFRGCPLLVSKPDSIGIAPLKDGQTLLMETGKGKHLNDQFQRPPQV